jgi:hypothetical protein
MSTTVVDLDAVILEFFPDAFYVIRAGEEEVSNRVPAQTLPSEPMVVTRPDGDSVTTVTADGTPLVSVPLGSILWPGDWLVVTKARPARFGT